MNSNDFYRISDNVYSLNGFTHLMFHSKITDIDAINGKTKSYYNEYKTKNTKVGSVLIKRKLEYFFTLEYSYKGDKNSAMIIADQMYEVIDKFQYIRSTWFNPKNSYKVFGLVNEHLVVIDSRESIIIRCLCDKYIRIDPALQLWQLIINKNYSDEFGPLIDIYYQAEEPGCGLYYTNDPEGRFYCDQYNMDISVSLIPNVYKFCSQKPGSPFMNIDREALNRWDASIWEHVGTQNINKIYPENNNHTAEMHLWGYPTDESDLVDMCNDILFTEPEENK